jgi:hypothetical protein
MQRQTHTQDYLDFCGEHQLDFKDMDKEKAQTFIHDLKNLTFSDLVKKFDADLDQLAYYAVYAFSIGELSRNGAANFLEYRCLKRDFPVVSITEIGDINSALMSKFLSSSYHERLKNLLTPLPSYEVCFFTVDIPESHIQNPPLYQFLLIADHVQTISLVVPAPKKPMDFRNYTAETGPVLNYESPPKQMTFGSVALRDALTEAVYYEHSKKSLPRLGIFSIDTIGDSVEKSSRYIAMDYPSIPVAKAFHKIESTAIYIGLHDDVHRRLMSFIPQPIYQAYLAAIQMLREKIGTKWSRELWDAIDMELIASSKASINFADYMNLPQEQFIEMNTKNFIILLNAKIISLEKPIALFTSSPYIDTTWLLLIDIALNPNEWLKRGIDFTTLPNSEPYHHFYQCVLNNLDKIKNAKSCGEQVAIVKSAWFEIPLDMEAAEKFKFVKEDEKDQPRYLQVKDDSGSPLVESKKQALFILNNIQNAFNPNNLLSIEKLSGYIMRSNSVQNFLCYDPYIIKLFHKLNPNIDALNLHLSKADLGALMERIITSTIKFAMDTISEQSLMWIIETFPQHRQALFESYLKSKINWDKLTMEGVNFLLQTYPEHESAIFAVDYNPSPEVVSSEKMTLFKNKNREYLTMAKSLIATDNLEIDLELDDYINLLLDFDQAVNMESAKAFATILFILKKSYLNCQTSLPKFIKNLEHISALQKCFEQLNEKYILNNENINLLLTEPAKAQEITSKLIDKKNNLGLFMEELDNYKSAKTRPNVMRPENVFTFFKPDNSPKMEVTMALIALTGFLSGLKEGIDNPELTTLKSLCEYDNSFSDILFRYSQKGIVLPQDLVTKINELHQAQADEKVFKLGHD